MPIVQFYLVDGQHSDEAIGALLIDATHFYVDTLYPNLEPKPLDRVRAFISPIPPQMWATAGQLISQGGRAAPYFICLALAGRPTKQLQRLLEGFTDLVERHLDCERSLIRGQIISLDPNYWSIGGRPASDVRRDEADLRAKTGTLLANS